MSSDREDDKITFFENIYYWLWLCMDKVIPKRGMDPPIAAAGLFSVFRALNIFVIIAVASILVKMNILTLLLQGRIDVIVGLIIFALLLMWYDERKYQRWIYVIVEKYEKIDKTERRNKMHVFLIYIIITISTACMLPWLSSFYLE